MRQRRIVLMKSGTRRPLSERRLTGPRVGRLRRGLERTARRQQQQEQCALSPVSGGEAAGFPALHDRASGVVVHPPFPTRPTALFGSQFEHG